MNKRVRAQTLEGKDTHCASVVSVANSVLDSVTAARWPSHPMYKIFTALQEGDGRVCSAAQPGLRLSSKV